MPTRPLPPRRKEGACGRPSSAALPGSGPGTAVQLPSCRLLSLSNAAAGSRRQSVRSRLLVRLLDIQMLHGASSLPRAGKARLSGPNVAPRALLWICCGPERPDRMSCRGPANARPGRTPRSAHPRHARSGHRAQAHPGRPGSQAPRIAGLPAHDRQSRPDESPPILDIPGGSTSICRPDKQLLRFSRTPWPTCEKDA
jgi:hypothetical protein